MKNYDFEIDDVVFDDPSLKGFNDAWSQYNCLENRKESVRPSISDLVELFIEYRKRVGKGSRRQERG